jgi:hypothetical protein
MEREAAAQQVPARALTRSKGCVLTLPDYSWGPSMSPTVMDAGESPKRLLNVATAVSILSSRVR